VERLRGLDMAKAPPAGFVGVTMGVRRASDHVGFLALSTWTSIEAVAAATQGPPDQALPSQPAGRTLERVGIDLFEVPEGPPLPLGVDRGGALGIVWAKVAPHAEAAAHEMIRAVGPEVGAAGVAGIHVGRRVVDDQTELLVVASWRDRLALHEFAQHRARGTLDPAFLELMTEWRFETYDCVVPGALSVPPAGPAILLADDQARYIDASPGIETLLGVPAELVLRRTLADLTPPAERAAAAQRWAEFLARGEATGTFDVLRPDGAIQPVAFRAVANCPRPGIHASVLARPDDSPDPRTVAEIVADAFPDAFEVAA
jgi:PAS domain-containing protein